MPETKRVKVDYSLFVGDKEKSFGFYKALVKDLSEDMVLLDDAIGSAIGAEGKSKAINRKVMALGRIVGLMEKSWGEEKTDLDTDIIDAFKISMEECGIDEDKVQEVFQHLDMVMGKREDET